MSKIDTSTWKEFKLNELFESFNGDTDIQKIHINGKGVPVISAGEADMGVIGKTDIPAKIFSANTITVDMFGNVFFRDFEYKMATHARVFSLKFKQEFLSKEVGLYLATSISKLKEMFSFNNMCSWNKIKDITIKLPVTEVEEIDFEYMAARIKELEAARIKELEAARIKELEAALRVMGLHDTKLTDVEIETLKNNPKFKKFKMGALFEAQTGDIDLQQKDVNGKGVFFVNSGLSNCGIKGKTDRHAKTFPSNTITVDFWGNAFYRDFEYKMATHNHVFSLSGDVIKNERVGLYLVVQMSYFKNCFSYTNMGTWNKIKELEIELPITDLGELDFDYMENYILAIEKQTIQKLYDDKGVLINATKKIV